MAVDNFAIDDANKQKEKHYKCGDSKTVKIGKQGRDGSSVYKPLHNFSHGGGENYGSPLNAGALSHTLPP